MAQRVTFKAFVISVFIFFLGIAIFPIVSKVMDIFIFSYVETNYPTTYPMIYLVVVIIFLIVVGLASLGLIKMSVPKKLDIM